MLALIKRELKLYFITPVAYIFTAIFILTSMSLTFYFGSFFSSGVADLTVFFSFIPWVFIFFVSAVTMKSWSEEKRLGTIELGDFTRDISVLGRVVAAVSPTVYAPADGTITLAIEAGYEVQEGQLLATLDSPELTSKLFQQQATWEGLQSSYQRQKIQAKKQRLVDQKSVDLANVKLTTAKREKRRADQGYKKNAISQIDFEKAQDDLENATLQFSHAVQDAELNIESLDFDSKSLGLDLHRQKLLVLRNILFHNLVF
mgnify:CR=1 FL=1